MSERNDVDGRRAADRRHHRQAKPKPKPKPKAKAKANDKAKDKAKDKAIAIAVAVSVMQRGESIRSAPLGRESGRASGIEVESDTTKARGQRYGLGGRQRW